jgi:hypothetical protein
MGFKKIVGVVLLGMTLALGSAMADAKSRVSSKPSSYSSSSSTRAATVQKSTYSAPKAVTSTTNVRNVAPAPRTAAPSMFRSTPKTTVQKTTVIQKNYYGGNRGYSNGGNYGGGSSYNNGGSGSGLGTSIVGGAAGAVGGMLLMDALTEDEGEKALKLQQEQIKIEEARAQQERDDKQDQILENQEQLQDEGQAVIPEPSDSFFKVNPQLLQQ